MVKEMRHQILTYGRDQVARLVKVFVLFGVGGHIGYLADVHEIFYVQLKLALYVSETSLDTYAMGCLPE